MSVEHSDAVEVQGVWAIDMGSYFLMEPCGSGRSRITYITRVDTRSVLCGSGVKDINKGGHKVSFMWVRGSRITYITRVDARSVLCGFSTLYLNVFRTIYLLKLKVIVEMLIHCL